MFKLSTKARYGTQAMLDLALHYGKGLVLLRDIAERQDISLGYLEQIIPNLKSAGLVNSHRGARGGYALAKSPSQITVKDIVDTLAGPLSLVECVNNPPESDKINNCVTMDLWRELSEKINFTLESQTLQDLVDKHRSKQRSRLPMYYI